MTELLMNNELERIWTEVVMTKFLLPSQHLPRGTGENHEKTWSGQLVSKPRFESGKSLK
jgi:hypothetical protein